MKSKIFHKAFLLLTSILVNYQSPAQDADSYSLLTERFVDRPINVHRGQLQVNTGYELSVLNKKFDPEGKVVNLAKDGSAAMQHLFPFNIRFGLLEHLQLSAGINYARAGIRERNIWIIGYDAEVNIDELNEYKGLDNLDFGLSFRAPFGSKRVDWTVYGNISLPVFDHKPDQPNHSINTAQLATTYTQLSYYYRNKYGSGIPIGILGTSFRFNTPGFSAILNGNFSTGLKEGESILWRSNLEEHEFRYTQEKFSYEEGQQVDYAVMFAYQAIDWFAVILSVHGTNSFGGWSNVTGKKVGYRSENLIAGGLGYEIMASTNLRIFQSINIPFAGKNTMGSLIIHTGISLNFISASYHNIL
jgi:hypothetical protein